MAMQDAIWMKTVVVDSQTTVGTVTISSRARTQGLLHSKEYNQACELMMK